MRDPPNKATKHGSQTMEILEGGERSIGALREYFERSVADYLATTVAGAGDVFAPPPPAWRLHGWAVVLRSGGYQTPHFHPDGIVSGVYYVRVPEAVSHAGDGEAGCIRFGWPADSDERGAADDDLLTMTVRPEEGTLILFPSYFWHNTIPFESPEDRICIAFDVLASPAAAP